MTRDGKEMKRVARLIKAGKAPSSAQFKAFLDEIEAALPAMEATLDRIEREERGHALH